MPGQPIQLENREIYKRLGVLVEIKYSLPSHYHPFHQGDTSGDFHFSRRTSCKSQDCSHALGTDEIIQTCVILNLQMIILRKQYFTQEEPLPSFGNISQPVREYQKL